MSLTALAWISSYILGIFLAFVHPIYGLFTYFMDYYAHPPLRWWGKALPDYRWSLIIAIITLIAFLIKRNSLPKLHIKKHPQTKWLILFLLNTFAVTPIAVWGEENKQLIEVIIKIIVILSCGYPNDTDKRTFSLPDDFPYSRDIRLGMECLR